MSLLYEAGAKNAPIADVLAALPVDPDPMAVELVEGVVANEDRIDDLIAAKLRGWTLERLPVIDRTVLRIACFELLERPDVPTAVVIDEAVELAKSFSTDDSGRYVNGVLSAIARDVRPAG